MVPIDLTGKLALITGVGDDESFAWFIAKALQAAGARLVFACHPRMMTIVNGFLERDMDAKSRVLPYGGGELKVEKVLPCDVSFDTMDDVDEKTRNDRRYAKHGDYSIKAMVETVGKEYGGIDILIHSVAFSPEIKNLAINTSRQAYLTALSVSAYSLTALLHTARPYLANRPGGASAIGLSYIAGERVIPHYGGGMGTAKAALQIDAAQLACNLGPDGIRVNIISAGPYPSRAARAINPDFDKLVQHTAERSPLKRPIKPEEVADEALFLCSPFAAAITGQVLYVDCGYHVMGVWAVDAYRVFDLTDRELWLVTAQAASRRGGLIATFVNSASIVPELPRVLVCLANQHHTRELIETSGAFGLHLLAEEQTDLVWRFGLATGRDTAKFDGLAVRDGPGGVPLLEGVPAWLACRVEDRWGIGDRTAYIAEVVAAERNRDGRVLTFQRLLQLAPPERREQLKTLRARDAAIDAEAIRTWRQARS